MFFWWGLSYIGLILGGPFLIIFLLREVVRAVTPPRRMSASAACDRCGYEVAGLKGTLCPECGIDLMVSGIRTPALEMRRRGHLGWALFAWTVSCTLVGVFATTIITWIVFSAAGGFGGGATGATLTTDTATLTAASGSLPPLEISAAVTTDDATGNVESVNLTLSAATVAPAATFSYMRTSSTGSLNTEYLSATDPSARVITSTVVTGPPSAAAVSTWLSSLQPDNPPAQTDPDVQELVNILAAAADGTNPSTAVAPAGLFTAANPTTSTTPTFSPAAFAGASSMAPAIVALAIMALWVLGLILIPIRRSTLRRRFGLTELRPRTAAASTPAPSAPA